MLDMVLRTGGVCIVLASGYKSSTISSVLPFLALFSSYLVPVQWNYKDSRVLAAFTHDLAAPLASGPSVRHGLVKLNALGEALEVIGQPSFSFLFWSGDKQAQRGRLGGSRNLSYSEFLDFSWTSHNSSAVWCICWTATEQEKLNLLVQRAEDGFQQCPGGLMWICCTTSGRGQCGALVG